MLPTETWPVALRWATVVCGAGAGVASCVAMARAGRAMKASGGAGIVAIELAGTPARAAAIKAAWGPGGRAAARRSLLADFAFVAAYVVVPVVVAGASAAVMRPRGWSGWTGTAIFSGWAMVAAGALDVVENAALLAVLRADRPAAALTRLAAFCARGKFLLVLVAPLPLATAGIAALARV
ncbi:MAG TPA: hypothetical protein VNQ77_05605 [Frankiaceae bacterium]|nr:hypothetical protein [Frankiaceae bacterium]